jgi:hypothetical protein
VRPGTTASGSESGSRNWRRRPLLVTRFGRRARQDQATLCCRSCHAIGDLDGGSRGKPGPGGAFLALRTVPSFRTDSRIEAFNSRCGGAGGQAAHGRLDWRSTPTSEGSINANQTVSPRFSHRDFLTAISAASAAGVLSARTSLADEGPPETTTIRLNWYPNICLAPGFISEDLLRAEGFTDVRYVRDLPFDAVARGDIDFDFDTAAWVVSHLDAGKPILALSGGPASTSTDYVKRAPTGRPTTQRRASA